MPNEVMRDRYYSNIRSKLSFLVTEIRLDNSVNLQTLNIHAENIFAGVLNILYGWSLKNANAVQQNAAGIDLFDAENKVVVQVSSKHTHKKIQEESIDKIIQQTISDGDPTPRYKGYHYYFLAIAEIARPTKAFTIPDWLTFEPKKDIFDLTKLLSDVLNSGPETQKELSDLLDREMASETATKRMKTVAENTPLLERNPFRFDAETVSFAGREREMEQLHGFLEDNPVFKWWAIVGPGGSGKTRLAYELKKELDEDGKWSVEFAEENIYHLLETITNDMLNQRFPDPTLLICEDAQNHTHELGICMKRLAAEDFRRNAPIRLLLIARDSGDRDKDGLYALEKAIRSAAGQSRKIGISKHSCFISTIPNNDTRSLIASTTTIIGSFAESMRNRDPSLPTLSKENINRIVNKLQEIDAELMRPLYAMCLADAFLHNPEKETWTSEEVLASIAEREEDLLTAGIHELSMNDVSNESFERAVKFVWRVAAVIGEKGLTPFSVIERICRAEWNAIEENARKKGFVSGESLLRRIGIVSKNAIEALKPDILGEYMVLKWLEGNRGTEDYNNTIKVILSEYDRAKPFYETLSVDFQSLLKSRQSLLDAILPGGLPLTNDQILSYLQLALTVVKCLQHDESAFLLTEQALQYTLMVGDYGKEAGLCHYYLAGLYRGVNAAHSAMTHDKQAVDILKKSCGRKADVVADAYEALGIDYDTCGMYEDALEQYQNAYCIRRKASESMRNSILIDRIANTLSSMGQYKELKKLHRVLSNTFSRREVAASKDECLILANMGLRYYQLSDYSAALGCFDKVLPSINKFLESDLLSQSNLYNALALTYHGMANYKEGLRYSQKTLEIRQSIFEKDAGPIASAYNNIALSYQGLGNYKEAKAYFQSALHIYEKIWGPDSSETATVLHNLAMVADAQEDYVREREYLERVLRIREKNLGTDNLLTANVYNDISLLLQKTGNLQKAVGYGVKALNVREKHLGTDNLGTAYSYNNLGYQFLLQNKIGKAIEYFEKARVIREAQLGKNNKFTATVYNNLGLAFFGKKDYPTARRFLQDAEEAYIDAMGEDCEGLATVYFNQAHLLEAEHKYREALSKAESAYAIHVKYHDNTGGGAMRIKRFIQKIKKEVR